MKVIVHPSFTQLRTISWINRVNSISKWKISYKDLTVSASYLNLFGYLKTNPARNKVTDLQTIINGNVDIVSIAETKLDAFSSP